MDTKHVGTRDDTYELTVMIDHWNAGRIFREHPQDDCFGHLFWKGGDHFSVTDQLTKRLFAGSPLADPIENVGP